MIWFDIVDAGKAFLAKYLGEKKGIFGIILVESRLKLWGKR